MFEKLNQFSVTLFLRNNFFIGILPEPKAKILLQIASRLQDFSFYNVFLLKFLQRFWDFVKQVKTQQELSFLLQYRMLDSLVEISQGDFDEILGKSC